MQLESSRENTLWRSRRLSRWKPVEVEEQRALVDAILAGVEDAIAVLFDSYLPLLSAIARGDRELACDCLVKFLLGSKLQNQEIAVRPVERWRSHPERPLVPYLIKIVRNEMKDRFEKVNRHQQVDLDQVEIEDQNADFLPHLHREEVGRRIRDALKELKPKHRRAFEARYVDGMERPAAALRLGIPLATFDTDLRRARLALRRLLEAGNSTPSSLPPPTQTGAARSES